MLPRIELFTVYSFLRASEGRYLYLVWKTLALLIRRLFSAVRYNVQGDKNWDISQEVINLQG